ncbi:MAG: hypothetical protein M1830_002965 [Pleopsidium flavum]|nr:MAG: hypothetical protein M1830_002965 [Pleopsidium flavum]
MVVVSASVSEDKDEGGEGGGEGEEEMIGPSFSRVASKQRAEGLVVEVWWLVEKGEEEVVVGSVVKMEEEEEDVEGRRDADGLVDLNVVVMRTVVPKLNAGGDVEEDG